MIDIDKKALIAQVLEDLNERVEALYHSARSAYEGATHEESRAEDKYDTRGLEASYLAGAQAKRTVELEEAISRYRNLPLRNFGEDDPIALAALVLVETEQGASLYFMGPEAGGIKIMQGGESVTVITPKSPLGRKLTGSMTGDEFEMSAGGVKRSYTVIAVA